jgi:hypothetical protein
LPVTNIGIYCSVFLFGIFGVVVGLMFFQNINPNMSKLNKYIQNDCRIFDKDTMKLDEYFLNKKIVKKENPVVLENANGNPNPVGVALSKLNRVYRSKSIAQVNINISENYSKIILADNNNIANSNCANLSQQDLQSKRDLESQEEGLIVANNNFMKSKLNTTINLVLIEEKDYKIDNKEEDNSYNNKNNEIAEIDKKESTIEEITEKDYKELTIQELLIYDKRAFKTYLKESIIKEHRIINIIFKRTIFQPLHIKLNKLIFELSIGLALNAIMYTANYIDKRATANDKVTLY